MFRPQEWRMCVGVERLCYACAGVWREKLQDMLAERLDRSCHVLKSRTSILDGCRARDGVRPLVRGTDIIHNTQPALLGRPRPLRVGPDAALGSFSQRAY